MVWTAGAEAATRNAPRPAQRGRRRSDPRARYERAGASEDAAGRTKRKRSSWQHLSGEPGGVPLGGVFGQPQGRREPVAQRAPVRGRAGRRGEEDGREAGRERGGE